MENEAAVFQPRGPHEIERRIICRYSPATMGAPGNSSECVRHSAGGGGGRNRAVRWLVKVVGWQPVGMSGFVDMPM